MSVLQEQAVQMIRGMSDENVSFLIEVIQRLVAEKPYQNTIDQLDIDKKMQAFRRLNAAREEIKQYLPENFDPDKELEEARAVKYGNISLSQCYSRFFSDKRAVLSCFGSGYGDVCERKSKRVSCLSFDL